MHNHPSVYVWYVCGGMYGVWYTRSVSMDSAACNKSSYDVMRANIYGADANFSLWDLGTGWLEKSPT